MTEPVWKMSAARFQALAGVHQPFIMEVSHLQLSRMGKRARKEYDEKRAREWQASADCKAEYARRCFEAYMAEPELLKSPELHRDAKDAIYGAIRRSEKAELDARFEELRAQNQIRSAEELRVNDRVFTIMGGEYVTVTKLFKASLRGVTERGEERKLKIGYCSWLSYRDLEQAAKDGKTTIRPERAEKGAEG